MIKDFYRTFNILIQQNIQVSFSNQKGRNGDLPIRNTENYYQAKQSLR